MAFLLIPVILLAVVWLSYVRRRLSELNENVNTAMNQIGLQLSSRFRALEALLELARTHGLSAQLVLLPPSINALSTPAQVLEQEQHLAQAMSYITVAAESHPSLKADPAYQRCMEAANCYSRMVYIRSLIYNDSLTRLNCALEQKRFGLLAGLLGIAPREYLQFAPDAPVVLKVENLNAGKMVQDVSFELRKGEILGFSGLMGAGRTETARALFGADPKQSGKISIMDKQSGQLKEVTINSPQDAVKYGIGYLSEDRRRYGVVVQKSVNENTTLATMEQFTSGILINKAKEKEVSEKYIKELATKTPNGDQLVVNLSGGNQQKVVIAKWLTRDSDILIFDEPTRGIDVGAKNEIYKLMSKLAAEGKSIIMVSEEIPELLGMSDRILIMKDGVLNGQFAREDNLTESMLIEKVI